MDLKIIVSFGKYIMLVAGVVWERPVQQRVLRISVLIHDSNQTRSSPSLLPFLLHAEAATLYVNTLVHVCR